MDMTDTNHGKALHPGKLLYTFIKKGNRIISGNKLRKLITVCNKTTELSFLRLIGNNKKGLADISGIF